MVQKGLTHKSRVIKKRESPLKQPGEEYGIIQKCYGCNRFEVLLVSIGKSYNVGARGALHKERISPNDVVLCQKDTSSSEIKYFIIWKYKEDEAHDLKRQGELKIIKQEKINDNVVYEGEVTNTKNNEIEIDDNFIEDL